MEMHRKRVLGELAVVLALPFVLLLTAPGDDSAPPQKASREAILNLLMRDDMMYGADDVFGENADLSYIDRLSPTPPPSPVVVVVATTSSSHHHDEEAPPEVTPEVNPDPDTGGGGGGEGEPDDGEG